MSNEDRQNVWGGTGGAVRSQRFVTEYLHHQAKFSAVPSQLSAFRNHILNASVAQRVGHVPEDAVMMTSIEKRIPLNLIMTDRQVFECCCLSDIGVLRQCDRTQSDPMTGTEQIFKSPV